MNQKLTNIHVRMNADRLAQYDRTLGRRGKGGRLSMRALRVLLRSMQKKQREGDEK